MTPRYFHSPLLLLIALVLGLVAAPAMAQTDNYAGEYGTFILVIENDKFGGGTDQYYSTGALLTWVSPDISRWVEDERLPKLLTVYGEYAPFVNSGERERSVSLSMGQTIFTPVDVYTEELVENDRPYAGWLFASMGLHSKNEKVLDVFETTIGMVGPSALGKQVQNNFHNLIGVRRSDGWDHQLKDEPGLMFTWQRSFRWFTEATPQGWGADIIPHTGATVGNIYTYANLGGEFRLGFNLPNNFGSSLIGPATGVSAATTDAQAPGYGAHFFAGFDGRAVARNIFLDGNTWQDSPRVDKLPLVADLFAGFSMNGDDYTLTYTQALRTKEFHGQEKIHMFGSLLLSVAF
ncbi:MAG: lipid A deacylase LpxR family protein [Proteobacteria bacterium]|nr:lipid A deacylase LpxR family protein [Pseudomonadota bacterium]MBU1610797.1 lipid A deacylase LpxR family protein [Pseudomonadota bacterium]